MPFGSIPPSFTTHARRHGYGLNLDICYSFVYAESQSRSDDINLSSRCEPYVSTCPPSYPEVGLKNEPLSSLKKAMQNEPTSMPFLLGRAPSINAVLELTR